MVKGSPISPPRLSLFEFGTAIGLVACAQEDMEWVQ